MSAESLPAHNENLAGDALTTLVINYKWRKIISEAIDHYLQNFATDDITLDNQDLLDALYLDLYNFEGEANVITHSRRIIVGTTRTVTSVPKVILNDLTFLYTFTTSKTRIRLLNLTLVTSNQNATSEAEIRVNGVIGTENTKAVEHSWNQQNLGASALFEGLNDGTAKNVQMYWSCDNGQVALAYSTDPIWEIIEYD